MSSIAQPARYVRRSTWAKQAEDWRDVEKNGTDASTPIARHFNLLYHSGHSNILTTTVCALSYTTGTQKAVKISNKNSSFNSVHSLHTGLVSASHSTNLFTNSCQHISTNGKSPSHSDINQQHPTIPLFVLTKG